LLWRPSENRAIAAGSLGLVEGCVRPGEGRGDVATELPNPITHTQTRHVLEELYSTTQVTPDDVAEVIAFILSRPDAWPSTTCCSGPQGSPDPQPHGNPHRLTCNWRRPIVTTWFITGCSTGLGRAFADAVLARGHNAVVTARDVSKVADLAAAYPDTALALALSVTDDTQVIAATAAAEERFGSIDVLVNNAGYGYRAAVEEGEDDAVRRLFDTHVFGTARTIKAVLPGMRAHRSGTIVNLSSIGARLAPEGSGYYAAAKAAVEALTLSLRKEVAPLGITAMVVEPGAFRTDFAGRSLTQAAQPIADYALTAGKRRKEHDTVHGTQPGDPRKAAAALIDVVESGHAPYLLLLGNDATNAFRSALDALRDGVDAWESTSRSTDLAP
jgi:NADP-dependent 3-hydroxy acid dehydrogenase YdfG